MSLTAPLSHYPLPLPPPIPCGRLQGVEPWFTEQGVAGLAQVNFLGPLTLTRRLSECMAGAAESSGARSRIVNLCSVMHRCAARRSRLCARTHVRLLIFLFLVPSCSHSFLRLLGLTFPATLPPQHPFPRHARLPEDPQFFLKDWWVGGSYRNCKLALTMTTALLQRQLGPRGVDCVSVDPGECALLCKTKEGGRALAATPLSPSPPIPHTPAQPRST